MKIAMIIPEHLSGRSFLQPPLDMALCKTYLRQLGHDVQLIDNRIECLPFRMLAARIKGAELIVIPTTLYDCMQNYWVDFRYKFAEKTINFIKKSLPHIKLVVCGSHATVRPDLILRDTLADVLLLGEYEKTLCLLAETLKNKRSMFNVPNLILRSKGEPFFTKYDASFFHPEPENNILPDYSYMNFDKYYHEEYVNNKHLKSNRWGTILAGRGCPYNCLFCYNFFGKKSRVRTPESVVDELVFMQNKARLEGVYFIDTTFGLDKDWVFQLCGLIKAKNLNIPWNVESRCDLLPLEVLREMKSAHCNRIWVGIESFDEGILRAIKKGIEEETIETFLDNAKRVGIKVGAFINFGLPNESLSSLNYTIGKLHKWGLNYTKSIIIGSPKFGTDYYTIAKKQYPYIGNNWSDINAVSGLVANKMRPNILKNVVNLMYDRSFIYGKTCPKITETVIELS